MTSSSTLFGILRRRLSSWAHRWREAMLPDRFLGPYGYRQPLPFDHWLFSKLDTMISFDTDSENVNHTSGSTAVATDEELHHEPDHPISHPVAEKVVTSHHSFQPWEDIPPYQRSRGYNDQPAYTDDYDHFLWLPRDPLSTLDLDDTVEMRLSLTTSAGGSGTIGDWPPGRKSELPASEERDRQKLFVRESPTSPIASPTSHDQTSPQANSERRLIEVSANIGSEVDEGMGSSLIRRTTRKASDGLLHLFGRPRANTDRSDATIPMRTLSHTSSSTSEMSSGPPSISTSLKGLHNNDPACLTPVRKSMPQALPIPADQDVASISNAVHPGSGSQISITSDLRRSPSGRQPSQLRTSSKETSLTADPRAPAQASPEPLAAKDERDQGLRAPNPLQERSSSALSPQRTIHRDRSASLLTAQQQALMEEVMEEERLTAKDAHKEEKEDMQKEEEEIMKERDRIRRTSNIDAGIGRSPSRRAQEVVESQEKRPPAESQYRRSVDG